MSAPTSVSSGDSRSGAPKKFPPVIAFSAPHNGLVVLDISRVPPMILMGALERMPPQDLTMHDLIIALAFIGMVIAPAVVAAKSSREDDDPD
jgi:hypothetical protein